MIHKRFRPDRLLSVATLLTFLTLIVLLNGCTPSYKVIATTPSPDIAIDGKDTEWQQSLTPYDDGRVLFAASNDAQNLYLCIMTSDRFVQHQILGGRMVVWFDSTGGTDEVFGMRFPEAVVRGEETPFRREGTYNPEFDLSRLMLTRGHRAEFVGEDEKSLGEVTLPSSSGLDARLGYDGKSLVWEAKIPLGVSLENAEGVTFSPKQVLGVGLETPKFQFNREPEGEGAPEGRRPGGRGGRGFGGGRPGGGRPGGQQFNPPERVNLWFKVHEAVPASEASQPQ